MIRNTLACLWILIMTVGCASLRSSLDVVHRGRINPYFTEYEKISEEQLESKRWSPYYDISELAENPPEAVMKDLEGEIPGEPGQSVPDLADTSTQKGCRSSSAPFLEDAPKPERQAEAMVGPTSEQEDKGLGKLGSLLSWFTSKQADEYAAEKEEQPPLQEEEEKPFFKAGNAPFSIDADAPQPKAPEKEVAPPEEQKSFDGFRKMRSWFRRTPKPVPAAQ